MLFNYFLDILKRDFYSDRKAANGLDKRKRKKRVDSFLSILIRCVLKIKTYFF